MKLSTFAAGFLAVCLAVGAATLAVHEPPAVPAPGTLPAAPTAPPVSWPNYSGPGFVTPAVPDGDAIAAGYRLVTQTYAEIGPDVSDRSLRYAGNNLACQNCHLDGGTSRSGLPLVGIFRTYPKYSGRDRRVISLVERVNECMTRSMNGRALHDQSREMAAFIAYIRFIGEPAPAKAEPEPPAALPPDAGRGRDVYLRVCAACHQPDGLGVRRGSANDVAGYQFPPLWGPDSFNDGAGMDRFDRAVGFIRHNMPRGIDPANPQLSLQEAWDVAAFLQGQPRPSYRSSR
jgi:thiosulfate dehydrogenase